MDKEIGAAPEMVSSSYHSPVTGVPAYRLSAASGADTPL